MFPEVTSLRDEGLGNTAYLVDLGDGAALVVDPERIIDPYVAEASRRGLTVRYVVETHLHADFVSGGRQLTAEGGRLLVPAAGDYIFDHQGLADGAQVDLGGLTLQAIATPGHTPEHLAYLLSDATTPLALFSGGTLMAGAVARPDLVSPEQTEPLARAAYRSIHRRLLSLPDDLPVYPTHGGGSFCATAPPGESTTTIGRERASNPLLQAPDEDAFVEQLLGGLGSFPPYFLELREVNRRGPALLRGVPALDRLEPADVAAEVADGAVVVDARPVARFARAHVPESVSIELRSSFGTWLGWVVPFGSRVVVVLDEDQEERDLVGQALTVGYEQLVGRLDGGVGAWLAEGRPVSSIPLVKEPAADDGRQVVDVRQASEWQTSHVPGATHRELGSLVEVPGELVDRPALTHCGHGQRAMTGASLLRRAGNDDVVATTAGPDDFPGSRS